jgi:hypothetical protein
MIALKKAQMRERLSLMAATFFSGPIYIKVVVAEQAYTSD